MKKLRCRTATADDAAFAFECETATMRPYAIATWGEWPEEQVRARAYENARAGTTQIIEFDGQQIGILRVERSSSSYDLKQVCLLPGYQRQGIGSTLIYQVLETARHASIPVKLRVLNVNPAKDLYKRLGFRVVATTPEYEYLEYAS